MKNSNKPDEKFFIYLFSAIILAILIMGFFPVRVYPITYEDGPIENSQTIFELLGAYFCIKIFFLRRKLFSRFDLIPLIIGALFLFSGGEEISWGQRIAGLKPVLENYNYQREPTIHNLKVFGIWFVIAGEAFLFTTTGILPILTYVFKPVKKFCLKIGIPLMPRIICLSIWCGSVILCLSPLVRYGLLDDGKFHLEYEFIALNSLKQISQLFFSFVFLSYIFVEYYHLLKYRRSYEP